MVYNFRNPATSPNFTSIRRCKTHNDRTGIMSFQPLRYCLALKRIKISLRLLFTDKKHCGARWLSQTHSWQNSWTFSVQVLQRILWRKTYSYLIGMIKNKTTILMWTNACRKIACGAFACVVIPGSNGWFGYRHVAMPARSMGQNELKRSFYVQNQLLCGWLRPRR